MSGRRQRTAWIEGVRVRLTTYASGRMRIYVTDPQGDYIREARVIAAVRDALVDEGMRQTKPVHIVLDHGPDR